MKGLAYATKGEEVIFYKGQYTRCAINYFFLKLNFKKLFKWTAATVKVRLCQSSRSLDLFQSALCLIHFEPMNVCKAADTDIWSDEYLIVCEWVLAWSVKTHRELSPISAVSLGYFDLLSRCSQIIFSALENQCYQPAGDDIATYS